MALNRTVMADKSPGSPGAAARRLPARQGSVSGPFAPTNPFTTPRHAEFVIPQRSSLRRPSTDLNK